MHFFRFHLNVPNEWRFFLLNFLLPKLLVDIRTEAIPFFSPLKNRKLGAEVAASYIPVPMRFVLSNPICLMYCICDEKRETKAYEVLHPSRQTF